MAEEKRIEITADRALWLLSPRLTVLVTTMNKEGKVNAAPFSFVGPISIDPPLCYVAVGKGKDTEAFARELKQFVINLVSEDFAQKAIDCEANLPRGVNELEVFGLHMLASKKVVVPSVKEAPATIECELTEIIEPKGSDHVLLIGKVVVGTCKYLKEENKPDLDAMNLIMHVAKEHFRLVGKRVDYNRKK
ncbi:MAG: flavin reductase family protein [Candidatus Diapherotrites archaeon]